MDLAGESSVLSLPACDADGVAEGLALGDGRGSGRGFFGDLRVDDGGSQRFFSEQCGFIVAILRSFINLLDIVSL